MKSFFLVSINKTAPILVLCQFRFFKLGLQLSTYDVGCKLLFTLYNTANLGTDEDSWANA